MAKIKGAAEVYSSHRRDRTKDRTRKSRRTRTRKDS